jgi:type II secretory pathway component PulM
MIASRPVVLLRLWWQARPSREQNTVKLGLVVLAVVLSGWIWAWLRAERIDLQSRVADAEAQVKEVQDDLAEMQRLRGEAIPPQLSSQALVPAISNSLSARKLELSVAAMDADRLRVQGMAGFDESIQWLGSIQRDYRLRVLTLLATRQGANVKIDVVLGVAGK